MFEIYFNFKFYKMKTTINLLPIIFSIMTGACYAQQKTDNRKNILDVINKYSQCVIERDSSAFYDLFNDGNVTWSAALKDRSQAKEVDRKGLKAAGSNYFSGSYKGFFRSLYRMQASEDKFDNIRIVEDGTVANVSMDYSFWANHKMTNWGGKYLSLIKRDGHWKITSVIFSLEYSDYFQQPTLKEREDMNK